MNLLSYYVPLRPFERQLVSELAVLLDQHTFQAYNPKNATATEVFTEWTWSGLVKRSLNDDLGDKQLREEYGDNKTKAYNAFIHFLARTGGERQNLARAEDIRNANEDFLLKLGARRISDVEVVPVEEDLDAWKTL